jgi:chromosome segregation ATPase
MANKTEWAYCPECGCEDVRHEEGEHKQCADCHQEWFSSVDYSDVVRKHLSGKYIDKDAEIERLRSELGECKGEYDRAVNKVDALREQLERAQADLVRMTEGRDGLRSTLDEANKIIAWQRTELDQMKKNAGHSALRREAFDKLTQAGKSAGPTSGDVYAYDSEEPAKGSDA